MKSAYSDPAARYDGHATDGTSAAGNSYANAITNEFRNVFGDIQELMRQVAHDADPAMLQMRAKIEAAMASVKDTLSDGQEQITQRAQTALRRGDRYVHDQPWQAVGIAAVAGVILGVVLARR